jgi:hypothetical protein
MKSGSASADRAPPAQPTNGGAIVPPPPARRAGRPAYSNRSSGTRTRGAPLQRLRSRLSRTGHSNACACAGGPGTGRASQASPLLSSRSRRLMPPRRCRRAGCYELALRAPPGGAVVEVSCGRGGHPLRHVRRAPVIHGLDSGAGRALTAATSLEAMQDEGKFLCTSKQLNHLRDLAGVRFPPPPPTQSNYITWRLSRCL